MLHASMLLSGGLLLLPLSLGCQAEEVIVEPLLGVRGYSNLVHGPQYLGDEFCWFDWDVRGGDGVARDLGEVHARPRVLVLGALRRTDGRGVVLGPVAMSGEEDEYRAGLQFMDKDGAAIAVISYGEYEGAGRLSVLPFVDEDGNGAQDLIVGLPTGDGAPGKACGRIELRSGETGESLWEMAGQFPGEGIGDQLLLPPHGPWVGCFIASASICDSRYLPNYLGMHTDQRAIYRRGRVLVIDSSGDVRHQWLGVPRVVSYLGSRMALLDGDRLLVRGRREWLDDKPCEDGFGGRLERYFVLEAGKAPRFADEFAEFNHRLSWSQADQLVGSVDCDGDGSADDVIALFRDRGPERTDVHVVAADGRTGDVLWKRTGTLGRPTAAGDEMGADFAFTIENLDVWRSPDLVRSESGKGYVALYVYNHWRKGEGWYGVALLDPAEGSIVGYGPNVPGP